MIKPNNIVLIFIFGFFLVQFSLGQKSLQSIPKQNQIYPQLQSDSVKTTLYRSKIQISEHEFSGILIVKCMTENNYRTLFTTETGIKIFDFEFIDKKGKMVYGLGPLKMKVISKKLMLNLMMLLPISEKSESFDFQIKNDAQILITKDEGYVNFYEKKQTEISRELSRKKKQIVKAKYELSDTISYRILRATVQNTHFPITAYYQIVR